MLSRSLTVAAAVTFFAGIAPVASIGAASSVCDRFSQGEREGHIQDVALDEVSGIAASRQHPGVLWAHNDSGHAPKIYGVTRTGESVGTYDIAGAENIDWEDIAIGPGPSRDVSYVYLGDIGANFRERDTVTVYRFPEPPVLPADATGSLPDAEPIHLRYPGGIVDAEALIVDPRTGDVYVLTKERGFSRVLRARSGALRSGATVLMEEVAVFDVGPDYDVDPSSGKLIPPSPLPGSLVTGADISPDGSTVVVRTYHDVLAFSRPNGRPLAAAFGTPPCRAPQRDEPQGEAVAFASDGSAYVTVSEGVAAPVYRFAVVPALNGGR